MTTDKPTKAIVWKTIYSTLIDAGIVPVDVRLHPADILVTIELPADAVEDVAAALKEFGLPDGQPWTPAREDSPYLWNKGEAGEFYAWGRYTWTDGGESPLLPGWGVEVYCHVLTANYPLSELAELPVREECADLDCHNFGGLPEVCGTGPLFVDPDHDGWENDFHICPTCRKPRANGWTTHCDTCDGPQPVVSGDAEAVQP